MKDSVISVLRRIGEILLGGTEQLAMHGRMTATLYGPDGKVKEQVVKDNLIVNVGWDFLFDAMGAPSGRPGVMSHIGVGTSSTAAAAGQTDLQASTLRKAATYAHVAGTKVGTWTVTFSAGEATAALQEAGIFNALSTGIMFDRVTFSVINKGALDTLVVTFTVTGS